jgi:glycosyltransferase involved in cell wall biosynthesis
MALKAIASSHEVCVLGHGKDSEAMERAREEGLIGENVRFFPHGEWGGRHANRIVARMQNWRDYQNWSRLVLETGRRLDREVGFDVVHHVTLSTWRVPSELWRIGKPFVWGPVGGGEIFPVRLLVGAGMVAACYELMRRFQDGLALRSQALAQCLENSACVFASTPETLRLLRSAGFPGERMKLLSAAFFDSAQVAAFKRPLEFISKGPGRPLRLFAGGDIEARKGYHIALGALAEARRRGVDFEYRIAGSGPHVGAIKALAGHLGIGDRVRISEALSGEEYRRALWESDVYFLPSLRDSAGITLMEAMLAGCVPLVADCGGPGMIVDDTSGFKVEVGAEKTMVAGFADRLAELASGAPRMLKTGESARVRIEQGFSENNYLAKVEGVYRALR